MEANYRNKHCSEISKRARERKRPGSSLRFFIGFAVGLISGLVIAFLLNAAGVSFWGKDSADGRFPVNPPTENSDGTDVIWPDENVQEQDDGWNLVLVNRWNPLQGTNGIKVTTLSNGEKIDERIYPYLQSMFDDMRNEGVYPVVASGYRTKEEQENIYNEKIAYYQEQGYSYDGAKAEAEKWVAVPGTSEHQLGLAVDINADGVNSAGYEVYDWLDKNAYRYGFIKRYPSDKTEITGISNEPWHYRYVGKSAAKEIYEQGVCLEEYFGKTNG